MLNTTSEHALRALTEMASLPEGEAILGRDLAKRARIPANYLSKILWALGNEGIIDATRGSGGGYRLKRRPEEIHLIDVVELFEKSKGKPACLLGDNRECTDVDPCSAHESWRDVRSVYIRFLESTTIAAIAGKTCAPAKKKGLTQISTR